jgi:N6-adenosine-specific RNA methylase IME4
LKEKQYVIECNVMRRQLTLWWRAKLAVELEKIEAKLAEIRMKAGTLASRDARGKASQKAAKKTGVGQSTIERTKIILENADKETIAKLDDDKTTIKPVYNKIMNQKRIQSARKVSLPTDKYNILYIDPPWKYDNESTGGSLSSGAAQKYPTMSTDEIISLFQKIQFAPDSVIFMWTTNSMLPDALRIISEIGFTYKGKITWVKKDFLGLGYWFRNVTEDCLFAIKGDVRAFRCQLPNYIQAKPGQHSEKPDQMRNLIEDATKDIYPKKRIELFARKESTSWKAWGNEI